MAPIAAASVLRAAFSPSDLGAVLDHLLQNAVDAAGPDGHIALAVAAEDERVVLIVSDDGPGMSEEFIREQLFRPLVSGKADGYGLGAFQCRELVRAMGGRLEVVSTVGAGTSFKIHLRAQSMVVSADED